MDAEEKAMLRELWDRSKLQDLPRRYSRGVDLRDWGMVRSCFTDDCLVEGSRETKPVDEYFGQLRKGVEYYPVTMHFMGNQLISVDGDSGFVDTYCVAFHWKGARAGEEHPENLHVGVRYQDRMRRTESGWLISGRKVQPDWRVGVYPDY